MQNYDNNIEIYPEPAQRPYYIVAPPYSRFSAGIKVLHLLCHALNRRGQRAFMLILPDMPVGVSALHPDLLTPRLTQDVLDVHASQKYQAIAVYPETIRGNPLNAPVVARYVLNVPGLLGGDKIYAPEELVFCYSQGLCAEIGREAQMLFLPVTNTRIYNRSGESATRKGSCFYAKKFKSAYPDSFSPPHEGSIEITAAQSPEDLADLYRRVEKFYCYESTSTALDAALCGCITVSLPNEMLKFPIGADSLGMDGHAWGDTPEEIRKAKATIDNILLKYQKSLSDFWQQLDNFIDVTQKRTIVLPNATAIRSPFKRSNSFIRLYLSTCAVVRYFAWRGDMRLLLKKAFSNLSRSGIQGIVRKLTRGTV